jgi:hypothetical protein
VRRQAKRDAALASTLERRRASLAAALHNRSRAVGHLFPHENRFLTSAADVCYFLHHDKQQLFKTNT